MKKIGFRMLIFLFAVFLFCCGKEENEIDKEIYNTWEVVDFMSIESVLYAKDDNFNPIIEFKKDGTLEIKPDVNSCFGDFELVGNNKLVIGMVGCTEICCDSDFSNRLIEILPQVMSYSIEGNKLELFVSRWGTIKLELHEFI